MSLRVLRIHLFDSKCILQNRLTETLEEPKHEHPYFR